ncbi:MAG: 2-dehydropantoate 2-reductase [Betaproteobacteria bacterium]
MRILIIGPGAVGCYFGSLLARAGHAVTFAARPTTAAALRGSGIRIEGSRGAWTVTDISVASEATEPTDIDVALLCVKLYDTASAARQWQPALARAKAVVSLQNGVDAIERLDEALAGRAAPPRYGGLAFVAGQLVAPGHVRCTSDMSSIRFGGPGATTDPTLLAFADACVRAGFAADCLDDIASAQWHKFAGLATNAALTCLVRKPAGACYGDDEIVRLAVQSIAEIIAVGTAAGATFPAGFADDTLRFLQGLPADMFASMHHDLAAGKQLELDALSGHVVRSGRRHGIATPFHHMAWACLRPHLDGDQPP